MDTIGEALPDPGPRQRPDHRVLRGQHVMLTPFDAARDALALFEASHGDAKRERVWLYLPAGPFESPEELGEWYTDLGRSGDPLFYTVRSAATEAPVGVTSFLAIEHVHASIEIGHIWYTPAVQRTAVNTETCLLLFREAFERLGYRRLEWKCDGLNERSRSAALGLGFTFEGEFRQHRIVRGRNRDTAWFSILDAEWPAVASSLEQRLTR